MYSCNAVLKSDNFRGNTKSIRFVRYGIPITTFMIASDPLLVQFVENLTEINRGRAFFASLGDLEGIVFKDFLQNRQRRVR